MIGDSYVNVICISLYSCYHDEYANTFDDHEKCYSSGFEQWKMQINLLSLEIARVSCVNEMNKNVYISSKQRSANHCDCSYSSSCVIFERMAYFDGLCNRIISV